MLLLTTRTLHLTPWGTLTLISWRLHLDARELRLHHSAVVNLLLLGRKWSSLRVARHLRERGVHRWIAISTAEISPIVIVAITTNVNLHSCVSDGRQGLMLISSHTSSHVEMISLGVRWCRVKHHSSFGAMMRTNSIKLVDIRKHSSSKIALLIFKSHALVASTGNGAMHWILCLHDRIHVLVIDRDSTSWCPLSVTRVDVASLTWLPHRGQHLLLLRSLWMLWPLL